MKLVSIEAVLNRVLLSSPILLFPLAVLAAPDPQVSEIRLQSITAYGHDAFTLTIHSNGEVQYFGRDFVDVKGRRTSQISHTDFDKLSRKIQQIGFLELNDEYDRYPLDQPAEIHGDAAAVEKTIVTDQSKQTTTVVTLNGTKTVADRMGPPKGLRELEELIVDVTQAAKWIGAAEDVHDIPYYESFPLNKEVTFRVLLEHYRTSGDPKAISGYLLMFMRNDALSFEVEESSNIDLSKSDGYIVDATGYIRRKGADHIFVVTDIRRVRRCD
jgi:hypothetical protein